MASSGSINVNVTVLTEEEKELVRRLARRQAARAGGMLRNRNLTDDARERLTAERETYRKLAERFGDPRGS